MQLTRYSATYESNFDGDCLADINENEDGDFVFYEDVAALEAEIAELRAKLSDRVPTRPTDISDSLREYAGNPGYSHSDYADTMRRAADECERFYGGMMNWKRTADQKDSEINELRAKLAAAEARTVLTDEQIMYATCDLRLTDYEMLIEYNIAIARAILAASAAPAAMPSSLRAYIFNAIDGQAKNPRTKSAWENIRKQFEDFLSAAPAAQADDMHTFANIAGEISIGAQPYFEPLLSSAAWDTEYGDGVPSESLENFINVFASKAMEYALVIGRALPPAILEVNGSLPTIEQVWNNAMQQANAARAAEGK